MQLRRKLTAAPTPAPPREPIPVNTLCTFGDLEIGDYFMIVQDGEMYAGESRRKDTPDTCTSPDGYIAADPTGGGYHHGYRHGLSIKRKVMKISGKAWGP